VPHAHLKTICFLSRGAESPAAYAPQNASCRPPPPGDTCNLHGASGNVGSRQGGIKGSAFSRSSHYLPVRRSSLRGVSPLTVPLTLNLKGYSQPSPTSYLSCTLLFAPTAGDRPHLLHSLVHRCLTSHTSINRVPPHRTRCRIFRLP
jgi:hypothetical protein